MNKNTLYLSEELNRFGLINTDKDKIIIHVLNKIDLIEKEVKTKLDGLLKHKTNAILLSCETNENLINLIQLISNRIDNLIKNDTNLEKDDFLIERHQNHLEQILENINLAIDTINYDRCISAFYIENSINQIAAITGKITTEHILDVLFNDFCIGK